MESVRPSFDVLLQTGLHRGLYGHNFYKKRRPVTSKSLQEGIEKAGRSHGLQDQRSVAGKADDSSTWHSGDKYSRPSTTHVDSEKRRAFDTEHQPAARWMSDIGGDLSPGHQSSRVAGAARSKVRADDSLTAMVLRASPDDIDTNWSSYSTLPRSSSSSKPYRHYPGASVISVEELPQPQRGTYRVVTEDDQAWSSTGSGSWRQSSDGPQFSVSLHDDQLMTYLHHETTSTPDDFTLGSLLAVRPQPASAAGKHEYTQRQQYVGRDSGYALDDEIGQLHRFLDNPFAGGRHYDRNLPKQQVRLKRCG